MLSHFICYMINFHKKKWMITIIVKINWKIMIKSWEHYLYAQWLGHWLGPMAQLYSPLFKTFPYNVYFLNNDRYTPKNWCVPYTPKMLSHNQVGPALIRVFWKTLIRAGPTSLWDTIFGCVWYTPIFGCVPIIILNKICNFIPQEFIIKF